MCGRVVGHDKGVRRIVGGMDPVPGLRVYVDIMTHTQLIHFNSSIRPSSNHQPNLGCPYEKPYKRSGYI